MLIKQKFLLMDVIKMKKRLYFWYYLILEEKEVRINSSSQKWEYNPIKHSFEKHDLNRNDWASISRYFFWYHNCLFNNCYISSFNLTNSKKFALFYYDVSHIYDFNQLIFMIFFVIGKTSLIWYTLCFSLDSYCNLRTDIQFIWSNCF